MAVPLMIAAAAASAYMQYRTSEAARGATEKELKRIDAMIARIKSPDFDMSMLTPEEYKVVGQYDPEVADYFAEANPTLVKADSEGARAGRDAQMNALQKYRNLSESGDDTQSRLLRQESLRDAQEQNQGQQASIQQNFAQRGLGGSGLELISAMMAQQGSNQAAGRSSEMAASEAYNRKLDALRQSAGIGGDIRNQDVDLESKNAGIINDYNRRFADSRRAYDRYAADTRNDGQRYNLGVAQDVANKNVSGRNDAAVEGRNRADGLKQQIFSNDMSRAGMSVNNVKNGIQSIATNAQDTNNAISGVAQGVTAGAQYAQGRSDRAEDQEIRARERQEDRDQNAKSRYGGYYGNIA